MKKFVLFVLSFSILCVYNSNLWAHSQIAHQYFSEEATKILSAEAKNEFTQFVDVLREGASDEDDGSKEKYGNPIYDPDTVHYVISEYHFMQYYPNNPANDLGFTENWFGNIRRVANAL